MKAIDKVSHAKLIKKIQIYGTMSNIFNCTIALLAEIKQHFSSIRRDGYTMGNDQKTINKAETV